MYPLKPNDPAQLGDWSITARLGQGEDSVIYLGVRGVAGSEEAAIKLIEADSLEFESALEKIKNEVEALKRLDNTNIVKLLEANYEPGNLWIATEYINGVTLDTKLKQSKIGLKDLAWFRLAENIFHGLEAAHAEGIIHKDIKPSNIILSQSGAKLIDFGISHVPERTRMGIPGDFEGSRFFSAPENYNRKHIQEMDVFSTGVTLAYAAKLKSVWVGDNPDAIRESIKNDAPDLTGLTLIQQEFIAPLLEKLPIDRPSAAISRQKALEYIEYLLDTENIKKPSTFRRRKNFSRKFTVHPVKAASFGLAFVGAFLSFAIFVGLITNPFSVSNSTSNLLRQCQTNLRDGSIDLAVASCAKAVELGNNAAKLYLARAYRANGSDNQAKVVLEECKSEDLGCRSDFAYFFETGTTSLTTLKDAYSKGNIDAAWRIGFIYQKNNDYPAALSWYEKGHAKKSAIADIYLAFYYAEKKQYTKALSYGKKAIGADLSSAPQLFVFDYPIERLVGDLYQKSGDIEGEIAFFKNCANAKVIFCVSKLAGIYLAKKDFINAELWGLKGADLQDGYSMWVVARVHVHRNGLVPNGKGDPAIEKTIFEWYEKSAARGEVKGMLALGVGYGMGMSFIKLDWKTSCGWYQKTMVAITDRKGTYEEEAEDANDYKQASQFFELQFCQNQLLGDNPKLRFSSPSASPSKASSSADCELAFQNNKSAISKKCVTPANEGDIRSIYYMGRDAADNGRVKAAETWFLKAAKKDDVSSMGQLAEIYLNSKNLDSYKLWVSKCADYSITTSAGARCKLLLGMDLLRANETSKGILYLKDSYEYGNGQAALMIAIYYYNRAEFETAISWYVKAAELDDSTGINELIKVARKLGKTDLYMKWLKISADAGNGKHAFILGTEYFIEGDYNNAEKYARLGATAGDDDAMSLLGAILYKVNNDIPNAKIWLTRSAKLENLASINLLGLIARVEFKNYTEALSWYNKAAALGDLEAKYFVGALYAGGFGNGPAACAAFGNVIDRVQELKNSGKYEPSSMDKWLTQAQAGIKETC